MIKRILLFLLVSFSTGCSMTSINDQWKDPGVPAHSFHSFLVVGLPDNSPVGNECADEFVKQLAERNLPATAGYGVLPPRAARETVMAKARELGRDAVLVGAFRERRTQLDVYPSEDRSLLLMPDSFLWSPDQMVENRYDVFATYLYDTATGKPVWSAVSDTLAGRPERKVVKSYVKAMLKRMEKEGLLPR